MDWACAVHRLRTPSEASLRLSAARLKRLRAATGAAPGGPASRTIMSDVTTIRPATEEDVPTLLALIRALAIYEKAEDRVEADEATLRAEGFGPRPAFEAIIAFVEGRPAGFALYLERLHVAQAEEDRVARGEGA